MGWGKWVRIRGEVSGYRVVRVGVSAWVCGGVSLVPTRT